jgi:hypothetical protein
VLDTVTRSFLADETKNRYLQDTDTLVLSPIFGWYKDDFGGKTALRDFYAEFGPKTAVRSMQTALKSGKEPIIEFSKYDWTLNE